MLTPALNIQFSQISKIKKLYSKAEKQVFTKENETLFYGTLELSSIWYLFCDILNNRQLYKRTAD